MHTKYIGVLDCTLVDKRIHDMGKTRFKNSLPCLYTGISKQPLRFVSKAGSQKQVQDWQYQLKTW